LKLIEIARKLNYISVFQSPDGKYIASGAIDGIINIFDVSSGKLVHTLEGKVQVFCGGHLVSRVPFSVSLLTETYNIE
jgi:WD40 repeat protein